MIIPGFSIKVQNEFLKTITTEFPSITLLFYRLTDSLVMVCGI
jgi:hypothetical protein